MGHMKELEMEWEEARGTGGLGKVREASWRGCVYNEDLKDGAMMRVDGQYREGTKDGQVRGGMKSGDGGEEMEGAAGRVCGMGSLVPSPCHRKLPRTSASPSQSQHLSHQKRLP